MMQLRALSRLLLGAAALCMLAGGAFHGIAFIKVAPIIDASNLSAHNAAIFKGLWLSDSAAVVLVGAACLILTLWPKLATRAMLGLLAALPLAFAMSIYFAIGNFVPGHLLLFSGVLVLVVTLLASGMRDSQSVRSMTSSA
jgi:hypothetical protein